MGGALLARDLGLPGRVVVLGRLLARRLLALDFEVHGLRVVENVNLAVHEGDRDRSLLAVDHVLDGRGAAAADWVDGVERKLSREDADRVVDAGVGDLLAGIGFATVREAREGGDGARPGA